MGAGPVTFCLESTISPDLILWALKKVTEHPNQRGYAPSFEFDWIKKRLSLSANSPQGVEECGRHFLRQVEKSGGTADLFLPGKVKEAEGGRWIQAFGILLQDPAVFAQLIGHTLIELGFPKVRVSEREGRAWVEVRPGPIAEKAVDFRALVLGFPVPAYIRIQEESPPG